MGYDLQGNDLGKYLRQRKDGRYEARIVVDGKSKSICGKNLDEVKEQMSRNLGFGGNFIVSKGSIVLDEWFECWFDSFKAPAVRQTSIYPMKNKYYNSFGKRIGGMKLKDIRNIDIQRVINEMHDAGRSSSTMREALGRVRECMESAKNNGLIDCNPCFEVMVPWDISPEKERRYLSKEEQKTFLDNLAGTWYEEMFHIMFLTGMRIGEVGGLKWSDVDFEKKCIHINTSLHCAYNEGEKKLILTDPKTANSFRDIPFMGEAEEMFKRQLKKVQTLRKTLGKRYRGTGMFSDMVFVTTMGSPVIRYHAEKEIKKTVTRINEEELFNARQENREPKFFESLYPHAIRHTFCTRCFENGVNPKVTQKLMGHQHYSTTIDIYTHLYEETYAAEIAKIDFGFGSAEENQEEERDNTRDEMKKLLLGLGVIGTASARPTCAPAVHWD